MMQLIDSAKITKSKPMTWKITTSKQEASLLGLWINTVARGTCTVNSIHESRVEWLNEG